MSLPVAFVEKPNGQKRQAEAIDPPQLEDVIDVEEAEAAQKAQLNPDGKTGPTEISAAEFAAMMGFSMENPLAPVREMTHIVEIGEAEETEAP